MNKGIWTYLKFLPKVKREFQITLNEGNTDLILKNGINFKLEYLNPTGSVKDRGICYQLAVLYSKGIKRACISSSGNAAISATKYARLTGLEISVFVSPNIKPNKLEIIRANTGKIIITDKPVSASVKFSKIHNIYNLRQSTDPYAIYGFETLAFELSKQIPEADAVFFPVSSGTTLCGASLGFKKVGSKIAIHAVQTEKVHPIAEGVDNNFNKSDSSIADAIVAKYTQRKNDVLKIIKDTEGSAWIISDREILIADEWLKKNNISCSYEGALTLAGLFKAKSRGYLYKHPVCILTGKKYE